MKKLGAEWLAVGPRSDGLPTRPISTRSKDGLKDELESSIDGMKDELVMATLHLEVSSGYLQYLNPRTVHNQILLQLTII